MEQSNDFNATMDRFYQLFSALLDESLENKKDVEKTDLNKQSMR